MSLYWDIIIFLYLLVIALLDIRYFIVSNKNISLLFMMILFKLVFINTSVDFIDILEAMSVNIIIFGGLFYLCKGFIGGGDVKLALVLSIWLGLYQTIVSVYIAFILGGIIAVLCLLLKLKRRKDKLPFAPFLVLGSFFTHLFGAEIIDFLFR